MWLACRSLTTWSLSCLSLPPCCPTHFMASCVACCVPGPFIVFFSLAIHATDSCCFFSHYLHINHGLYSIHHLGCAWVNMAFGISNLSASACPVSLCDIQTSGSPSCLPVFHGGRVTLNMTLQLPVDCRASFSMQTVSISVVNLRHSSRVPYLPCLLHAITTTVTATFFCQLCHTTRDVRTTL